MYFVYSLLLTLGFLVLLPRFLFDALRHGKYVAGFGERLGNMPPLDSKGRRVVWLHCVSVGESQAARPLVAGIRKRFPEHNIVVSTTTLTGQKLAREISDEHERTSEAEEVPGKQQDKNQGTAKVYPRQSCSQVLRRQCWTKKSVKNHRSANEE